MGEVRFLSVDPCSASTRKTSLALSLARRTCLLCEVTVADTLAGCTVESVALAIDGSVRLAERRETRT